MPELLILPDFIQKWCLQTASAFHQFIGCSLPNFRLNYPGRKTVHTEIPSQSEFWPVILKHGSLILQILHLYLCMLRFDFSTMVTSLTGLRRVHRYYGCYRYIVPYGTPVRSVIRQESSAAPETINSLYFTRKW